MTSPPAQPVYRVAEIRAIEDAYRQLPLMERAGAAAAREALALMGASPLPPLVVCGPGNNGGDGLVVARLLKEQGRAPVVVFAGDAAKLPADARQALTAWRAAGGRLEPDIPPGAYSLAVDALFGIGLKRPPQGPYAALIEQLNGLACPVLALDVPSGLDADTGRAFTPCVRADRTATFIALKPGLLTRDGPDHSGEVSVHPLELEAEQALPASGRVAAPALFATFLRPRPRNSHKGMMGGAAIIGGAAGMVGAALLAGRAALKLGAGRVYLGLPDPAAPAVDLLQPELMLRAPGELLQAGLATALAAGPGLGAGDAALELLRQCLAADLPLVLDADALNLIARHPVLAGHVARRAAPTLLTPHPAEAARLMGSTTEAVQADRLAAALALAGRFNAQVVLKGNGSVLAYPDGKWLINTTGNPGMASAGMGDVLTGIAVALLAQGWSAQAALAAAVHLHGAAADELAGRGTGPVGLVAGEVIDAARALFNRWIGTHRIRKTPG
ncbi:MAG: NAD(P)H-hydrate dehydratase [Pseudomonadota bacterium]|jgi:hydroxyethylthiazole kinase-like uncharacterized protein yjeF